MRVYIVRHGTASHLLEDLQKKVNHKDFLQILEKWNSSSLTSLGQKEIAVLGESLKNLYSNIFYSPLKRTKQTATAFMKSSDVPIKSKAVPQLAEIYISPPRLPGMIKLKYWIYLCVAKSIVTFRIFHYLLQARKIIKLVKKTDDDILIISHQARIFTIIVYAFLSPYWRVIKSDFNPAGVSIIEKKKMNGNSSYLFCHRETSLITTGKRRRDSS
jgi:phosphohistidine phosphatase SixA